jgi:hypothetical protein
MRNNRWEAGLLSALPLTAFESTKMAAFIMESADIGAGYHESLAERLAGDILTVPYGLLCATDIAFTLRDLHHKGLAHGEVNPASIWLRASGARLQPRGSRSRSADARLDISAFGAVLYEMMTGRKPPSDVAFAAFTPVRSVTDIDGVRTEAIQLAERCLGGSTDMRQVVIELRILGLLTRGLEAVPQSLRGVNTPAPAAPEPHRLQVVAKPAAVAPEESAPIVDQLAAVAPEPRTSWVVDTPATAGPEPQTPPVADVPAAAEPEPQSPQVSAVSDPGAQGAIAVDADLVRPVASAVRCPRCKGDAQFVSPRSILDKLLNKVSHMRECDLCGYRYIVIHFVRQKKNRNQR